MVGNVTIQGQIVGTATFDGAKISAVVTIAPPINATVNFGGGISTVEQLPAPVSDSSNIYTWIRDTLLTGLSAFTDVTIAATDTILQGFAKLQGQVNAVKGRLGLLEDSYILKYVVPSDAVYIELTTDRYGSPFDFSENDVIEIFYNLKFNELSGSPAIYINANVGETGKYIYSTNIASFFPLASVVGNMVTLYGNLIISLKNKEAYISNECSISYSNNTHTSQLIIGRTNNKNIDNITKLTFAKGAGILAGSVIVIKKK